MLQRWAMEGILRTGALSTAGWTWGDILEVRLRQTVASVCSSYTSERPPQHACWAEATPAQLLVGHLPIGELIDVAPY